MQSEIKGITNNNFHDVVTLAHRTLGSANPMGYSRTAANEFIKNNMSYTKVLMHNGNVAGAYAYSDDASSYSLLFFSINERYRKTKIGYKLYLDMKSRLTKKPVLVTVYDNNQDMMSVVSRRGTFIGRAPSVGGTSLAYYSIMFDDFKKKD